MRAIARGALLAIVITVMAGHGYAQEVRSDRIALHGHEFIPRFTDLPKVLVVPPGHTVTLPADSTWDAIEVAGTLKVSRTFDTVCRFIHLTILPGGTLDVGTVEDPVLKRVAFIVRDVAINTEKDPYQWGNGIINLGHQSRVGRKVTRAWAELTEDVEAGATAIHLAVPEGWRAGDELLLPDTRQINGTNAPIRRESKVTITAISSDAITLSKPLDFEHKSVLDPNGAIVLRPRVANLTRNIVIRSENPLGVRGHTVNTGEATWDIRYNQLIGLGRTRAENLHSTRADPATGAIVEIGTNQIARYASHDHHVHAHSHVNSAHPYVGHFVGNVLDGTGIGKWGHVVHGTHDTYVEENVAVDFVGAGFVTEDGYEVRNVFRRNVAAYSKGNGLSAIQNLNDRLGHNAPGAEGTGFWFRGLKQVIEGNESWNNVVGINLFSQNQVKGQQVPSVPGGTSDTVFDPRTVPITFTDNVTLSNTQNGLEYWNVRPFPAAHHVAAYNGNAQVLMGQSNAYLWLTDATLLAVGGTTMCVSSSEAYTLGMEIDGGRMAGCRTGIHRGGARSYVRLRNVVLQNKTNVILQGMPDESLFENVLHVPLGAFPKQYIVLGDGKVWQPGTPMPSPVPRGWVPQRGARNVVVNWQGTGVDYRLYENQQRASAAAFVADGTANTTFYCPAANLTMGQCWDRYGLAYRGGVVPDNEAVALDGVLNGVGQLGRTTPLGTPRAVMTTPSMLAPAKVSAAGRIRLRFALTGDPGRANDIAVVQVDGGDLVRRNHGQGQLGDERACDTTAISKGTHTVQTWREDTNGVRIAASQMTFYYFVQGETDSQTASNAAPRPDRRPSSRGQYPE
jgi:hypothetical protein